MARPLRRKRDFLRVTDLGREERLHLVERRRRDEQPPVGRRAVARAPAAAEADRRRLARAMLQVVKRRRADLQPPPVRLREHEVDPSNQIPHVRQELLLEDDVPLVGLFERIHIPRALGALVALLAVTALFAGLGYLVVPPAVLDDFTRARTTLDDHPASAMQPVLAEFIASGHFAAHVRRMRRRYQARQEILLDGGRTIFRG